MLSVNRLALAGSAAVLACLCILVPRPAARSTSGRPTSTRPRARPRPKRKLLLVDFTGSDWCGWCIKLKQEVFDKTEFKTEVPKQFVLVELDFPPSKEIPDELKKQNEQVG